MMSDAMRCDLPSSHLREMPECPTPQGLRDVDLAALSTWMEVGVSLFSGAELPSFRTVMAEARGVLLALSKGRHRGNITQMVRALGASRRAVRDYLKQAGLYERPSHGQGDVEEPRESVCSTPWSTNGICETEPPV